MPFTPPPLVSDPLRLAALSEIRILDTPAEAGFDSIVQLTCQVCDVPVALVSLVAEDRQWFKARVNFPSCETDLSRSVCAHALASPGELLIIPDLAADPRTRANPLVTGDPFIRFYAGAPLVTSDGQVLGTLCAIDKAPRPAGLSEAQAEGLKALAVQVMSQLALHQAIRARDALRAEDQKTLRIRDALMQTQSRINAAEGDLDRVLATVVDGAMAAVPQAEGGTVALVDGAELEYSAARGTLESQAGLRLGLHDTFSGHCATTRVARRLVDATVDPHTRRDLLARLQLRSAVAAPILRGETVLGVLKLQCSRPDAFTDRDLEVVGLFAGAATVGFAEAAARAASRAKDVYWRGLFDRLSEGFIVGEVIRDAAGQVTDWRYQEVNPAWGALVDIDPQQALGRTVRDLFPRIEDAWITDFAQVVDTGQPAQFTRQVGTLRRWYEGRAFKLDDDRFGVIFLETTHRVEAEARRSALLTLGDRLRDLTTVPEMTRAAAEIAGRTLGASRAGFGRIEGDWDEVEVDPDWTVEGMVSIAGRHRFDDYGDLRGTLRRGESLVIDDVAADPRTRDNPAPMQAIGIGAMVNVPVQEQGRSVAVFIVHDRNPRVWTDEELEFLRNVADRLQAGTARVRAEAQQTVLNHELSHRLKNTLAVVQSIATQTLRGVTERELVQAFDRRILALSRAHDALLHKSWSVARLKAVMDSVLSIQADLDRFVFDGLDMSISPQAALSISLLLHELATNAAKYGALSVQSGQVILRWRIEDQGTPKLVFEWRELGGPPVEAPTGRTGFGSKLIKLGLMGTRDTSIRYLSTGFEAEFRAPLVDVQGQVS